MRGLLLGLAALLVLPALAGVRVQRTFDWRSGLPASFTDQVEQDPDGFLWIVTIGGVVRYDGSEAKLVAESLTRFVPGSVALGQPIWMKPDDEGGAQFVRLDGTLEPGPDGARLRAETAVCSRDGALWAVSSGTLIRRGASGWSAPIRALDGAPFTRGPWVAGGDSCFIATDRNVYRAHADGRLAPVAHLPGARSVIEGWDGSVVVGCWLSDGGHIYDVRDGAARKIQYTGARLMDMKMRGDVLWIGYDVEIVRIARGEPEEKIDPKQGVPGGGGLFVDREGSLWIANGLGLIQLPEPETVSWNDTFPAFARTVTPSPDGFWLASWSGGLHARRSPSGWTFRPSGDAHVNTTCYAPDGNAWAAVPMGFRTFGPHRPVRNVAIGNPHIGDVCDEDREGRVWFPTTDGLFVLDPGAAAPRRVPGAADYVRAVAIDPSGSPWIAKERDVCHLEGSTWRCETVSPNATVGTLRFMPSGDLWAGTAGRGLMRRRAGRWEEVPGAAAYRSAWIHRIRPSPAGGVWLAGEGILERVEERAFGLAVVERIGVWQGLPTASVFDVFEDDERTLWLATSMSLVKIPPVARFARPSTPTVVPVEVSVDGRRLDPGREIELPYRRNRLELRFAALSFREPALVRYRARLRPDEAWSQPTPQSSFRFVDLAAGRYRVEIEASLDGAQWSQARSAVEVVVLRPWWRSGWFFAAVATAGALGLTLAYRIRIRQLLRLERQRTRIAMDLHDGIGSGLGSIRILAGLAVRETTPDATRAQISSRIAAVADELAVSLGDIVWSLRPGTATLASLGAQLVSRAGPLLTGRGIDFVVEPEEPWPDAALSLAVRRHVFLIGLEAMHNAAKHAGARRVRLAAAGEGRHWRLTVEDDGRGMEASAPAAELGSGLGLQSIRKRAAEIGAVVRWAPGRGGGTVFTLEFDVSAEDRRTLDEGASHERATGGRGGEMPHSDGTR